MNRTSAPLLSDLFRIRRLSRVSETSFSCAAIFKEVSRWAPAAFLH